MRKLVLLLSVLSLAAFGLVACGGDDDDDGAAATTTEQSTSADTGGGGGGGGSTVDISADASQLAFDQDSADASAGSVTVDFTNPSSTPHDVRIEDADGADVGGTDIISDDEATASVDLKPGTYTFFCSVPGHREAGMEGTLTVE